MNNIHIISLKRRLDRRKSIESNLESCNIAFNFFDAFDAKEEGLERSDQRLKELGFTKPFYSWSKDKDLNLGRRGCLISHLEVLKQAITNQSNGIIIMEDDVLISNFSFPTPPDDGIIYYLGGGIESNNDINLTQGWNEVNDFKVWGCYCYYIPTLDKIKRVVDELLKYSPRAIDAMFTRSFQKKLNSAYYLNPSICQPDFSFSSDVTFISKNAKQRNYLSKMIYIN